ncbi:MLO protein homolog 1-like [Lolium rigidum]|uniref:MLO protein homolog 1-like n=1 Tax=Lolium rigidum TaxID=89674 RepID=UPI001F5D38CA|nr:MLO protein homolog 1-like [Lolium rigidum]
MRRHECLTSDPAAAAAAAAVYIPLYAGLDLMRYENPDVSPRDLVEWLLWRPEWRAMGGRARPLPGRQPWQPSATSNSLKTYPGIRNASDTILLDAEIEPMESSLNKIYVSGSSDELPIVAFVFKSTALSDMCLHFGVVHVEVELLKMTTRRLIGAFLSAMYFIICLSPWVEDYASSRQWFTKRRKKALFDALKKVKSELMTLGFISLLLTITARYISRICIPEGAADTMLPCRLFRNSEQQKPKAHGRRHLFEAPTNYTCRPGMVSLVSADGLHQLHIFVFFLAVFHVTFSAITMSLGRAKTRIWKEWENDTSSITYEFSSDPSKFRLTHQTSFVRQHASCWSKSTIMLYVVSYLMTRPNDSYKVAYRINFSR